MSEQQSQPVYVDEFSIDLGKYFERLFRQWRLIALLTIVCAFIAGLLSFLKPTYQARVLIASTKTTSEVSFGSAIQTLSEEQLNQAVFDRTSRLRSYVEQVSNTAVAFQVLDQVGNMLAEGERNPAFLDNIVAGRMVEGADTILITVNYKDPVVAAAIANAWGEAYVQRVNSIYASNWATESYEVVQTETAKAKTTYDLAQDELENFIAENKSAEINRKINELQIIIDSMSQVQVQVYTNTIQKTSDDLAQYYLDLNEVENQLENANDLLTQVSEAGDGGLASNALAITLLKADIFASGIGELENIPEALAASQATINARQMTVDVEALISSLGARKIALEDQIEALSDDLLEGNVFIFLDAPINNSGELSSTPLEQNIRGLEQQVRELNQQLAIAENTEQELTRVRDLNYQTYTNLASKEAELAVASQTPGVEVALASPAYVPTKPAAKTGVLNPLVAGSIGLAVGTVIALLIEFWWAYKKIEPQPFTLRSLWQNH